MHSFSVYIILFNIAVNFVNYSLCSFLVPCECACKTFYCMDIFRISISSKLFIFMFGPWGARSFMNCSCFQSAPGLWKRKQLEVWNETARDSFLELIPSAAPEGPRFEFQYCPRRSQV